MCAIHSELWSIGFSNDDSTGIFHSLDNKGVVVRHKISIKWRPVGRPNAYRFREVFHGDRRPCKDQAACLRDDFIRRARLGHQLIFIHERNDRVYFGFTRSI